MQPDDALVALGAQDEDNDDDDPELLSLLLEQPPWHIVARRACEALLLGLSAVLIVCLIHAALLFHASIVAFFIAAGSGIVRMMA
jgi:hypothetical protein